MNSRSMSGWRRAVFGSIAAAVLAWGATGCAGHAAGPVGGARTLDQDEFAAAGGLGVGYVPLGEPGPLRYRARLSGELRGPLGTERADLGFQLWAGDGLGAQIQPRIALLRSSDPTSGVDFAVAPGVGAHAALVSAGDVALPGLTPHAIVPLYLGINSEASSLQIGAFVRNNLLVSGEADSPTYVAQVGGSLGLVIPTPSGVRLQPTASFEHPIGDLPYRGRYVPELPAFYLTLGFWK